MSGRDRLRAESPVLHVPQPFNGWMVFDYETVKWIMTNHASFSSRIPAPNFSFIFTDPAEPTWLRNLISRAFTPRAIRRWIGSPALRCRAKTLICNYSS